MISAVVLTKNEEKNIEACLKSIEWCDEIVIVDDYSTDATLTKIQSFKDSEFQSKLKLTILKKHLNNDFAGQRNFGLSKTRGEWILFVDADEIVTPALKEEITQSLKVSKFKSFKGFYLKRKDFFLGKWLNFGETANVRLLRLVKKGSGGWFRRVHEAFMLKSGKTGELNNPILHYPHPNISEFLESINFHSSLHSQVLFEEGKRTNLLEIIFYPIGKICLNYFWRLGFLDDIQGLIMALMMSLHSFLARAKLYCKLNHKLNHKLNEKTN